MPDIFPRSRLMSIYPYISVIVKIVMTLMITLNQKILKEALIKQRITRKLMTYISVIIIITIMKILSMSHTVYQVPNLTAMRQPTTPI